MVGKTDHPCYDAVLIYTHIVCCEFALALRCEVAHQRLFVQHMLDVCLAVS